MPENQARCFSVPLAMALAVTLAVGCGRGNSPENKIIAEQKSSPPADSAPKNSFITPASVDPAALELPATPVAGEIDGQAFRPDKILISNNILKFRNGQGFFADQELVIFLIQQREGLPANTTLIRGPKSDRFSGDSIHVHASHKSPGEAFGKTDMHTDGYAVRLEFGPEEGRTLRGKIHLLLPDERHSYLKGSFVAEVEKDNRLPPDDEDVPYVACDIQIKGASELETALVGYISVDSQGQPVSNFVGTRIELGQPTFISSITFDPRITSLVVDEKTGVHAYHTHLNPGTYLVYVRAESSYFDWHLLDVKADGRMKIDMLIDLDATGSMEVTASVDTGGTVKLLPLDDDGKIAEWVAAQPNLGALPTEVQFVDGKALLPKVRPGRYRVYANRAVGVVEVKQGEQATLELSPLKPR